jgi:hypothetical protein
MVMSPSGLGTKNDCAGEDQQQITRLKYVEGLLDAVFSMRPISYHTQYISVCKVKLSLCLTKQTLWTWRRIEPCFLDLGTSWRSQNPRTGLDDVERRKILPLPELKLQPLDRPARSQSLYLLSYPVEVHRRCFEKSVDFYQTKRHFIPEDSTSYLELSYGPIETHGPPVDNY